MEKPTLALSEISLFQEPRADLDCVNVLKLAHAQ